MSNADLNVSLWHLLLSLQHPLSKIEIVPFEASLFLIYSIDKEIINDFMISYKNSEDLIKYIEKNS